MTEQTAVADARSIGQKFIDFTTKGQIDDLSVFSPNFVYHNPNGDLFNLEDSIGTMKSFFAAIPDHDTTIEDEVATDDMLVYRWTTRGHQLGVMQGLPPTGKPVAIIGATFIRIEDGKIAEVWDYVDLLGLLQQLGVVPKSN